MHAIIGTLGRPEATTPFFDMLDAANPPSVNPKTLANFAARFALVGREMRCIRRQHGCMFYEVRHHTGSVTCSTLHDLSGLLAQIGATA